MSSKPKSAAQAEPSALPGTSPEERLDGKLKAMFEAIERRSGPNVLPDLGSLPKARPTDRRN